MRRRTEEKFSVLYWFCWTGNSLTPSCPRSFSLDRTMYYLRQLHWEYALCHLLARTMGGSLCSLFIGFTAVKNIVCLSLLEFCPPGINPEFVMECNWLHIRYDKCTRRNCPELTHCLVVMDQWDCVLNDLEELGDKEFLVLMSQYNIEIFSCCLRLLAFCTSTVHQTNVEIAQNGSEDNLLFSRIQSPHLRLAVIDHDEEECSVFLPLGTPDWIEFLVQYQSIFFHE